MTAVRSRARLGLMCLLIAGCSPAASQPPASVPSPVPGSVPATLEATEAAPTSAPTANQLGEHWTAIELGDGTSPTAAVSGDSGFVIVGSACDPAGCDHRRAAAWTSSDGATWTAATVADPDDATFVDVAYNGLYIAAGIRRRVDTAGDVMSQTAVFWRSKDGTNWTQIGSLDLGPCVQGCPSISGLTVTQGGLVILGQVLSLEPGRAGPYRSADGTEWTRIDPSAFGYTADTEPREVEVVAPGVDTELTMVVANDDDAATAWSSDDGLAWKPLGTIGGPFVGSDGLSATSDGLRLTVADKTCPGDVCRTRVWTQAGDGSFEMTLGPQQLERPMLAFTGGGYVLTGLAPGRLSVWTSSDAMSWVERSADIEWPECGLSSLAAGPSSAILIGDGDCARAFLTRGTP